MTRTINADALALLKAWEGLRLTAYQDTGGVWTIGFGHVGGDVREGFTVTEEEAERLFRKDLGWATACVDQRVTVPLTDGQFGALVSFVYNIGETQFLTSTLLRKLNAGDYAAVPSQLARWNKDNGQVIPGLVNRRAAEAGLWAKGSFVTSAGPTTAQPQTPPAITKETVSWAATIIASLGAAMSGSGPVQWAFGVVIVGAALVGGFLFLRHRVPS